MKPQTAKPLLAVFALILSASIGAVTATLAQDNTLTKPLDEYVINDIFPRAVSESFADTGRRWRTEAENLKRDAELRKRNVENALTAKRAELSATKEQLKLAKREKDLVRIGMLEGTIKNEELSIEILKKLEHVAEQQLEVADAWSETGSAMEKFTGADSGFDSFRTRRLTRPEPGQPDLRLGPDGYEAFRAQASAMKDLGEAFAELGSGTESLAEDRLELLKTLEKGGHVQSPR